MGKGGSIPDKETNSPSGADVGRDVAFWGRRDPPRLSRELTEVIGERAEGLEHQAKVLGFPQETVALKTILILELFFSFLQNQQKISFRSKDVVVVL